MTHVYFQGEQSLVVELDSTMHAQEFELTNYFDSELLSPHDYPANEVPAKVAQ